jgi:uncharacterized protein
VKERTLSTESDLDRTCILTRQTHDPASMIRFVVAPDGSLAPDLKRRLPGRGVWLDATKEHVRTALRKKAFARAFKREVVTPIDLPEQIETLLITDARQSLAMANKAGLVITGFDRVQEGLRNRSIAVLLHAIEAARDGAEKLDRMATRAALERQQQAMIVIRPFTSREMDLALGREHVIHAALIAGAASKACLTRCLSLLRYRGENSSGFAVSRPEDATETFIDPQDPKRND